MTGKERGARRPLPGAEARWEAGQVLHSARFDDVYFSRDGGPAEKRHVFLGGCGLPDAWQRATSYTIGELGFGTGLNFLVTWDLWRRTHASKKRLHYLAVEGYPLTRTELGDCLRLWPELSPLSSALLRAYPEPQPGFHRLILTAGDGDDPVYLTLLYGEAAEMLAQVEAGVDAWYLDGFAPEKNPEIWRPDVIAEIARLSHGARSFDGDEVLRLTSGPTHVASYAVAGTVRQDLKAAGFEVSRTPGFGAKREMLRGYFNGTDKHPRSSPVSPPPLAPWFARGPAVPRAQGHVAIVGAGIAGCAMAAAMIRRGWTATLIDRHGDVAEAASGNPVGVLMPRLTAAPSLESRFSMAAWRFALQTFDDLSDAGVALGYERCGVLQLAADAEDAARLASIAEEVALPDSAMVHVTAREAAAIAGIAIDRTALFFPHGGCIQPRVLCAALAEGARRILHTNIVSIRRSDDWLELIDDQTQTCTVADAVILANGLEAATLPMAGWLPLAARRGQLTLAPASAASAQLRCVLSYGGYVTPEIRGRHAVGATFDWVEDSTAAQNIVSDDHRRNLAELQRVVPTLMAGVSADGCDGRAAIRCVTPDHLPVAGPLPDQAAYLSDYAHLRHGRHWVRSPDATYHPGVYLLTGLGARGLTEAPLAAELLACHITGEPWPLERDVVTALHPARFLVRDLKRLRA